MFQEEGVAMNDLNRRAFLLSSLALPALVLSGCKEPEDPRHTEEKIDSPKPDFKTRFVMACPKCGAPQRPYMVNDLKSFYRCSGLPPKFRYHEEYKYEHTINRKDGRRVEM
jgi:hypothetical protein